MVENAKLSEQNALLIYWINRESAACAAWLCLAIISVLMCVCAYRYPDSRSVRTLEVSQHRR